MAAIRKTIAIMDGGTGEREKRSGFRRLETHATLLNSVQSQFFVLCASNTDFRVRLARGLWLPGWGRHAA